MKALTVQQPWAWSIIHGGKLIENRTQQWSYRGPLAIHAGMRDSNRGFTSPIVAGAVRSTDDGGPDHCGRWRRGLTYGAILGVVDLVDCHPNAGCCTPWGEAGYTEHRGRIRTHITHLVLENPRPLADPIPCRGQLGLWTPPADVIERLEVCTRG